MSAYHLESEVVADPKRPWKALASGGLSLVGLFVAFWLSDAPPFTLREAAQGLLLAITGSGLVGGVTFAVKNPPTVRRPRVRPRRRP